MSDLTRALAVAVDVARAAGDLLRRETWRPEGPRGHGDHADVDDEAEALIRGRLLHAFPEWSYYGEETGIHEGPDPGTFWLVDPNDGTHAYLRGYRASTVSIGLVRGGRPVLGVVYAPCFPDDDGDLIAWAEECGPITRNGRALDLPPLASPLDAAHVVVVSHGADRATEPNLVCCAPARFRALPSIAYRLALVAVGDADAAVSIGRPGWLDVAGGHALLRARGGELIERSGAPVAYPRVGNQILRSCFGGARDVCDRLACRPWEQVAGRDYPASELLYPVRLASPRARQAPARLARAQGAVLGFLAGSALGDLAGGGPAGSIRTLAEGMAGQPGPAGEQALAVARALLGGGDATGTALARAVPLGLAGTSQHCPDPLLGEACDLVARAVAVGIAGGSRDEMYRAALGATSDLTRDALERASFAPPPDYLRAPDDPRVALHNAFYRLVNAPSLEDGVVETVREGGDAEANGALAGGLLGAWHGRDAVPERWRRAILSCRTSPTFAAARRPRPAWCWPIDALEIAERLLCLGS